MALLKLTTELYRVTQRFKEEEAMKQSYAKHAARIKEMKRFGTERFSKIPSARRRKERVSSSLAREVSTASSSTDH